MDLNATNRAFDHLLNEAGGRFHIVEDALKEASKEAKDRRPTYSEVLQCVRRLCIEMTQ